MQINKIAEDVQVTVVCITYNHEEIIREALDSFLMQETNFKYQIFVGEDKGPDNTAEIVKEYAEKYPDKIVAFLRDENMGAQRNLIDLCQHAKSPYIAFCEGDDYWIDPKKLQKQYDYMEANKDVNVCFARAEISAPEDWFLRDHFRENKEGKIIYPECDPACPKTNKNSVTLVESKDNIVMGMMGHTSTLFYRWNYDLQIPEWYYDGVIGDWSLFLMQLGDKKGAMLPDVVSVYRRSDVGVYMSDNMSEHFMKTRLDCLRVLSGMLSFYEENEIENYPKQLIIDRQRRDSVLYIQEALKCNDLESIKTWMDAYPQISKELFERFRDYFWMNRRLIGTYSWKGKELLANNRYFMRIMRPFVKFAVAMFRGCRKLYYSVKNAIVYLIKLICYWGFSLVPKKKNLWVFSGFMKKNYMDNSKYFFEYVSKEHPEIEAVWVTKDAALCEDLKEKGYQAYRMCSLKGILKTARAKIAVTDHFVMSDYSQIYGYNHRTKVVQLWHGVGFKSMGDGVEVKNTNVPGVRYSTDILSQPGDNLFVRFWKKIKFFFKAPVRELFEKYFVLVCPGQERVENIGLNWNMSEDCFVMAGHPRNIVVYDKMGQTKKSENKVMYAPTYRFNYVKEQQLINDCLDAFPSIQKFMEKIDGEFTIRLHPHTWRNYSNQINRALEGFDRIYLDDSSDIYESMLDYSYVITDYSSLALEFELFGVPAVFLFSDYEWYIKNEAGFCVDSMSQIPGPKVFDWESALHELENYINNSDYMLKERKETLSYYFTEEANSKDDSEVIVNAIKSKLKI